MSIWRGWLAIGAVLVGVYPLVPGPLARDVCYVVVGLASVVAILVGVRRNRPAVRAPWYLFAAGLLSWTVGDSIYSWNADVREVTPFPSSADALYLGAYPLLAGGIAVLVRSRGTRAGVASTIDSAIVVVGVGLLSWTWLAQPMLAAEDVSGFDRALAVAYPAGDIVLLAMLVRLVSAPGVASTALRLLVGAVVMQVAADTALAAAPSSSWDYAPALDLLWLGSYVCWGASALHPGMGALPQRDPSTAHRFTRRRLVVLGTAALLPSLTHLVAIGTGRSMDPWAVTGGSIALTALVLARTACAVGEIRATATQRDRLEEHLFEHASRDALTGLFNRAYLISLAGGALRRAQISGSATGLLVVNLDGFAAVNREWGPAAGDAVLRETGRRIRAVSEPCPVGRLGDDQFVVLVDGADAETQTARLAELLLDALRPPVVHDDQHHQSQVSIGASVSLDGGTDAGQLLQEALVAVRRARSSTADGIEIYDDFMRREHAHRSEVDSSLRRALEGGDLELYYQPVVAAVSGVVDGYEALLRWNDAGRVRSAADFVPVAERSDLICDIGRWVLTEATRQLATWIAAEPERFGDLTVAVNISGRHLAGSIVEDVRAALRDSGLPSHHLVLEVTESVLVEVPRAVVQLTSLRSIGVTISLDDFGTGFTSIGQLRHLPIDTIKIDRSCFDSEEPGSSELIALMTGAAHACGLLVVAEGIERPDQLETLLTLDCDTAQGFLFSRPMRAADVRAYRGRDGAPQLRVVRDDDPLR